MNIQNSQIYSILKCILLSFLLLGLTSCTYDPNIYSDSGYQSYETHSYSSGSPIVHSGVTYHRPHYSDSYYYPRRECYTPSYSGYNHLSHAKHYNHRRKSYDDRGKWKRGQHHKRKRADNKEKRRKHSNFNRPERHRDKSHAQGNERHKKTERGNKRERRQRGITKPRHRSNEAFTGKRFTQKP